LARAGAGGPARRAHRRAGPGCGRRLALRAAPRRSVAPLAPPAGLARRVTAVRRLRRRPLPAAVDGGGWPDALPPLLRRIYASRGAASLDAARPRLAAPPRPEGLLDIDRASALLADAIARERRILGVGDFDADGDTACSLAVRGL